MLKDRIISEENVVLQNSMIAKYNDRYPDHYKIDILRYKDIISI